MKKTLGILLLALWTGMIFADTPDGWTSDFGKAQKNAAGKNRILYVLFTGSDWCPYCVKLHDQVLVSPAFKKLAEQSLVLVYLDFPRKSRTDDPEQNRAIARKYRVSGFPTAVLMKPDGTEITRISGFMPADAYLERLRNILQENGAK